MSRRLFGEWGAELDDDDFACALAALGALGRVWWQHPLPDLVELLTEALRERPARWRLHETPEQYPLGPAANLAQAWKEAAKVSLLPRPPHPALGVCLECGGGFGRAWPNLDGSELLWVTRTLGRAQHVDSVCWASVDGRTPTPWEWPLDVGFFDDPTSRALKAELNASGFMELRRHVGVNTAEHPVELLLLPGNLEQALTVQAPPGDLLVHTAVVLGGTGTTRDPHLLLEALRRKTRAAAAVVLDLAADHRVDWLGALTEEVSHDSPLDVALSVVERHHSRPAPMMVSRPGAFRHARLSAHTRRVAHRAFALASPVSTLESLPDLGPLKSLGTTLRIDPFVLTSNAVALTNAIDRRIDGLAWDQESGAATDLLPFFKAAAAVEQGQAPAARFVRALVTGRARGERWTKRESFVTAGELHRAAVSIGPASEGVIAANLVFPDAALPPDPNGHTLDLHWVELTGAPGRPLREPQSATLFLPPRGASEAVPFYFTPAEGLAEYVARVLIVYRGRVLQTALLRAPIGAGDGVRVVVESLTRTFEAAGLPGRGFDVAMVLNNTPAGAPLLTAIRDGRSSLLPIGGNIPGLVTEIGRALDRYADAQDVADGLYTEEARTLLRSLARKGRQLRDALPPCEDGDGYSRASRVQIVSLKADAVLPLELCYEGPAPSGGARVCVHAADALRRPEGGCGEGCTGPTSDVICPLAFWALSKRIERHAYDRAVQLAMLGSEYATLRDEEVARRRGLPMGASMLWAVNARAEMGGEGTIKACAETLAEAFGTGNTHRALDWEGWVEGVREYGPGALAVIAHTDKNQDGDLSLVIEASAGITVAEIEERHIVAAGRRRPVVLALGCSTADESLAAFTVVSRFRQKGAAIVVGTLGKVIGRHAARTAVALLVALRQAASTAGEPAFGDVLLGVRRAMVADGRTMALGLVALGDADWRLVLDPADKN